MNEIYNWLISRQPDSQALRESGRTGGAVGLFLAVLGAIPLVGLLVIAPGAKRASGMLLEFVQQLPAWLFIAAPCVMMVGILTGPQTRDHTCVQPAEQRHGREPRHNAFERDHVSRMDLVDATAVMAQLPAAFQHFNNVHPHSSLKMRSPSEFRQHQQRVAQTGRKSNSV